MLISYYANKKSSPMLPSWQPSLISFNTPMDSGSIIKLCTLKHFQVPISAPGLLWLLCHAKILSWITCQLRCFNGNCSVTDNSYNPTSIIISFIARSFPECWNKYCYSYNVKANDNLKASATNFPIASMETCTAVLKDHPPSVNIGACVCFIVTRTTK